MNLTIFQGNQNLTTLYSKVDEVLERNGITDLTVPDRIKAEASWLAVRKMFRGNHFSICTLRDVCELHNIHLPYEREKFYETLHCISFGEMNPDFQEKLTAMLFDDLRPAFYGQDI